MLRASIGFKFSFFGVGYFIAELMGRFGGYCGGNLPLYGYWGITVSLSKARLEIVKFIRQSLFGEPPA
jgi:hypothetical protein